MTTPYSVEFKSVSRKIEKAVTNNRWRSCRKCRTEAQRRYRMKVAA